MNIEKTTKAEYRYPGSRPFYDTDIDRRLFFGRDQEKEILLHKVLADNLVVLYARSGIGKTSMINAGLNQALRDKGFIPLPVRFNDHGIEPMQGIYNRIKEIVKQKKLKEYYEAGEEASLWQYFKTVAFWSNDDTLLKPVLILDQFEEFFTLYSQKSRENVIRQLADLVNNKIPQELLNSLPEGKPFPYSDNPPNVKVIIAIREDYLGQLDEMSRKIPDIIHHRYRLLPLSREQARQAIIKPSQLKDEVFRTASFELTTEAVNMMLDFLCKRKEKGGDRKTDEVDPFQLQLLCRHIEDMVKTRAKKEKGIITVKEKDLGKEDGMEKVLEQFYDDQVKKLDTSSKRSKAHNLFEKGLISVTDIRLSLEEGEIKRTFGISESLLVELVNSRLLRSEPRVGSVYYELSHDNLVKPIRESQRKRKAKYRKIVFGILLTTLLIIVMIFLIAKLFFHSKMDISDQYLSSGIKHYYKGEFEEAINDYKKSLEIEPKNADAYYHKGNALRMQENYEEAIAAYKEAIDIDPNYTNAQDKMELATAELKYKEAIKAYKKAIDIDSKYVNPYIDLGNKFLYQGKYKEAIELYKKIIEIEPYHKYAYDKLIFILTDPKKYKGTVESYKKAFLVTPGDTNSKISLGEIYLIAGDFNNALVLTNDLLNNEYISPKQILTVRFIFISALLFQEKRLEAIEQLAEFIKYYKSILGEYERSWSYRFFRMFISNDIRLPAKQTLLLLQIIDLLEAPKKEGEEGEKKLKEKIKELEKSIKDVFAIKTIPNPD